MGFEERKVLPFLIALAFCLGGLSAFAQAPSETFNFEGKLTESDGTPVEDNDVDWLFEIMAHSGSCVLYAETFNDVDMTSTGGVFNFVIGTGARSDGNGHSFKQAFMNSMSYNSTADCAGGYGPVAGNFRRLRVTVTAPSINGVTPEEIATVNIGSSPTSTYAETLQGLTPANVLQVNTSAPNELSQSNLESVFTATNRAELMALIGGTSTVYMKESPGSAVDFNGQRLTSIDDPTGAQDAATKNYSDTKIGGTNADITGVTGAAGDGKVLSWNQGDGEWQAVDFDAGDIATGTINKDRLPTTMNAITMSGALDLNGNSINNVNGMTMGTGALDMSVQDVINTGHITMNAAKYIQLGRFDNAQESALHTPPLTAAHEGVMWYDEEDDTLEIWNGTATIVVGSGGGSGDAIADTDDNTKIQVEEGADDDFIRFDTAGTERVVITNTGNVGVGISPPDSSALLDLTSTTQGFAPPRMTTTQRTSISAPVDGLMVYDTDLNEFWMRANGAWVAVEIDDQNISSLGGQTGTTQTFATGATGTAPAISSTSDVHTLNIPLASGTGVTSGTISKTEHTAFSSKVDPGRRVDSGAGLSGGGDLSADRTIKVDIANQTNITPVLADELLISETSNSNAIRKVSLTALQTLIDTTVPNTDSQDLANVYGQGGNAVTVNATDVIWDLTGTNDFHIRDNSSPAFSVVNTGSVGIGTSSPDSSAKLEISSTTQGFLPPRMTTAQRNSISTPVEGLTVYNTTTGFYNNYDGSSWKRLADPGFGSGNSGYVGKYTYFAQSGCRWDTATGLYAGFAAEANCIGTSADGAVSAPASRIPAFHLASLPAGRYLVTARGKFVAQGTSTKCYFRLSDGTTRFGYLALTENGYSGQLSGEIEYTSAQTNLDIEIQVKKDGGSDCVINASNPSDESNLTFTISRIDGQGSAVQLADDDGDTTLQVEQSADEDIIRFSTAGAERMNIDASGAINVSGSAVFTGSVNLTGATISDNSIGIDDLSFASATTGFNMPQLGGDPTGTAAGQIYYNSTNSEFRFFNGSAWDKLPVGDAFMKDGSVAMTGAISAVSGTSPLPALTFGTDTDTGLYRPAADTIGFSAGGINSLQLKGIASGVNYAVIQAAASGKGPTLMAEGSNTNVDLNLLAKGTGIVRAEKALDATGGQHAAFNSTIEVAPGLASTASSAALRGFSDIGGAGEKSGEHSAVVGDVETSGSADISVVTGVDSAIDLSATGSTAEVTGISATINANAGTLGEVTGLSVESFVDAAVTDHYGLYLENTLGGSGSIANGYGIYIDNVIGGTEKYSIYSNANAPSYFKGNVGIGTDSPSKTLEVSGSFSASGATTLGDSLTVTGLITADEQILAKKAIHTKQSVISHSGTGAISVDFRLTNTMVIKTSGLSSAFQLGGMQHGSNYTIVVEDPAAKFYTFSGCDRVFFKPANGFTTAFTRTVYSIMYIESQVSGDDDCYINWTTGYAP